MSSLDFLDDAINDADNSAASNTISIIENTIGEISYTIGNLRIVTLELIDVGDDLCSTIRITEKQMLPINELSNRFSRMHSGYLTCNELFDNLKRILDKVPNTKYLAEEIKYYMQPTETLIEQLLYEENSILSGFGNVLSLYEKWGPFVPPLWRPLAKEVDWFDKEKDKLLEIEAHLRRLEDRFYANRMSIVYAAPEIEIRRIFED